jgi:hypothetical protein
MPAPDLGPEAETLIDRMTGAPPRHPHLVGKPIDLVAIDPLTLGDLWPIARAVALRRDDRPVQSLAADTARLVLYNREKPEPAFRGPACRDYLDLLAREAEAEPPNESKYNSDAPWERACFALRRCIDLSFEGLGLAARRFLAATDWRAMPHLAIALARLSDESFVVQALEKLATDLGGSPLLVDEIRFVASLDLRDNIDFVAAIHPALTDRESLGEARHPFSDYPGYAAFAEVGLKSAARRVRDIHDFKRPYASDKAFTLDESRVIERLARVALDRDEAWAPTVLDELFRKVSIAPTAAKSAPSQSIAIALGHAVEAFPTPEAVETLRSVLRDIRHAGIKLKLKRNLGGAERGLANRPEIALRLPLDKPLSKPQVTTLRRCLEAGLALDMDMTRDDWRARLAARPETRSLVTSLVWTFFDPRGATAVLPVTERGRLSLRDVTGAEVEPETASRVKLWHPLEASAEEREAWRDRLAALKIKQPFRQVFREHYSVPADERAASETAMFSGHVVSIMPFLGLARKERWRLEYDSLARAFGRFTARLDLADPVYPGAFGGTTTRNLGLSTMRDGKPAPVRIADLPATTLSEILRAIDLLVSVGGYALADEDMDMTRRARIQDLLDTPLGAMAAMRKAALERALVGLPGLEDLAFDARHLRLDPYAIHLATGRVTRDGDPVEIDAPKRASGAAEMPWLPHDEKLLQAIAAAAMVIARERRGWIADVNGP